MSNLNMSGLSNNKGDRHRYEYTFDVLSNTAAGYVVGFVGKNKRVLEIGCGPGSITRVLAHEQCCTVTGVDLDLSAIEKAAPYCERVVCADLNSPDWVGLVSGVCPFDVVVAADVLEHLYSPVETLKGLASMASENGEVVLSLPHVCHAALIASLVKGEFKYREWGLLDKTHIRFFSLRAMEELVKSARLKILDYRYVYKHPTDTEFASEWAQLDNDLKRKLLRMPHGYIYQVVIKAAHDARPGVALELTPPGALDNFKRPYNIMSMLKRYLPHGVVRRLRSLNVYRGTD